MSDYLVPAGPVTVEQYVKRSQFICHLGHCQDRAQAMNFIREVSNRHSGANHNCWAFIAGPPDDPSCWGMNDDGEPRGCAGKPMFNVIQHHGAGEICAVVTRYFGGIKLGTGGMARAYSSTVKLALDEIRFTIKIFYQTFKLVLPYALQKDLEHFITQNEGVTLSTDYGSEITTTIKIPQQYEEPFLRQLGTLRKGPGIHIVKETDPDPKSDQ